LISWVLKGFNCFVGAVVVRVRCGVPKLVGGLWKVADGDVETAILYGTVLSSLLGEVVISLAGVAMAVHRYDTLGEMILEEGSREKYSGIHMEFMASTSLTTHQPCLAT
jgi:hypothetical protein